MITYISPQPKLQFLDNNGVPLSGGLVYTYAAGTTTPAVTYTDATGNSANSNPVILDSRGECSIWLGSSSYKFKLTTSTNVEIWTVDNISVLTDSANIVFTESGVGAINQTVQSKLRLGYVYPEDFGAVGNGIINDTTALQDALNTGRDVYLAAGKTYLHTTALSVTTNYQWFGGPGVLKAAGAINSVNVGGDSIGVKLSLNFNSPGQTIGYAIYISNASQVTIERAYLYDAFGALYVEQANTVEVQWMWGNVRGPGIKWYGDAVKLSEILSVNFCVLYPGADYYGFDWDGNCSNLSVKYMRFVCGENDLSQSAYGFIVQNTIAGYKTTSSGYIDGTTMTLLSPPANPILVGMAVSTITPGAVVAPGTIITQILNPTNYVISISQTVGTVVDRVLLSTTPAFYPSVGRIEQLEIEYAKASAIKIMSINNYDFVTPYVVGARSDGLYINSTGTTRISNDVIITNPDDYNIRISGGSFIGNGGYGVNNTSTDRLMISGSVKFFDNTFGSTYGQIWNFSPTQSIDEYFYLTKIDNVKSRINLNFRQYIEFDAVGRKLGFFIGSPFDQSVFDIRPTSVDVLVPLTLKTYTVATLPVSPAKGWTAMVTDANATTFASIVAGGGSNNIPVYYDGTNWRIG
jgi:hypothetical protein